MKDSKIATLEGQRVSLLHKLGKLPPPKLNKVLISGKWTILQILEHIVASEELSIQYAIGKTNQPKTLENLGFKSIFLTYAMNFVLKLNFKHQAPSPTLPDVNCETSIMKLANRWEKNRIKLEELALKSPEVLKLGVFKHPLVGPMNFSQMLSFFSAHYSHHLVQINTLVELANFQEKVKTTPA